MSKKKVLTDKGLALRRYLAGLKMYIEVAETERLKMLQSPEGDGVIAAAGSDSKVIGQGLQFIRIWVGENTRI